MVDAIGSDTAVIYMFMIGIYKNIPRDLVG
jgi:hypothetical protein